jgi:Arc/MetJ-type ribon-helix-helix transcriptional regulator
MAKISVSLPDELKAKLADQVAQTGQGISELVRAALELYFQPAQEPNLDATLEQEKNLECLAELLRAQLISTGGRPARRFVNTLRDLPLTDEEWQSLKETVKLLKQKHGVSASAGQLGAIYIHREIVRERIPESTDGPT